MGTAASHDSDDGAPLPPRHAAGSAPRRPPLGRRPTEPPADHYSFEPLFPPATAAATMRPIECVSTLQKSGIVVNALSITKNSLRLLPDPDAPHSLLLQFDFDAQVSGAVTVYYCARPVFRREGGSAAHDARIIKVSFQTKSNRLPGRTPFEAGAKQRYRQNAARGLDLRDFSASELTDVVDNRYPLVIRLDASYPPGSPVPPERRVTSQTTFATLVPAGDAAASGGASLSAAPPPRVEIVAQEVLIDGTVYRILDLYGIGPADVTVSSGADGGDVAVDKTHECVICLTEACTYAVQPCNHLCLCDDCVRTLRFRGGESDPSQGRCPVCRTPIVRLFRIIPNSPGNLDEGETVPQSPAPQETATAPASVTSTEAPTEASTTSLHSAATATATASPTATVPPPASSTASATVSSTARPRPPSTEPPEEQVGETAEGMGVADSAQSFDACAPSPGTVTAVAAGEASDEGNTSSKARGET